MESYFIRHTKGMGVAEEAIDYLWRNNKIAIHFPNVSKDAPPDIEDCTSINPEDYQKAAKRAISAFKELNEKGGYVWAEYRNRKDIKVGKIIRGSFKIYKTKWRLGIFPYDRIAKLKTLEIDKKSMRIITPSESVSLSAYRPRQLTLSRWPSTGTELKNLVKRKSGEKSWHNLHHSKQETACSEYLRRPDIPDCPKLEHLLLPVGRGLENIDIYGYATDKKMLFAQVTYDAKDKVENKIQNLKKYNNHASHLIFFCDCEEIKFENGILFVPWQRVEKWLKRNKTYLNKLFPDSK